MVEYLALGDSYTIGTAVEPGQAFPALLARRLEDSARVPVGVRNLGVNGYTVEDLLRHEMPQAKGQRADLVSLLIGVNDFVQGRAPEAYLDSLHRVHRGVLSLGAGAVVAVSIPDFSGTPAAPRFGNPAAIRAGLRDFNRLAEAAARDEGFAWVDIFDLSRSGNGMPGWVATDGLHPGPAQHAAWAGCIWNDIGRSWSEVAAQRTA